jgi:putative ABC transport system permease protein
MRALDRKALRDLWHLRGPALAVAVVAMCGVAAFVSMRSMVHHLGDSQRQYYARARFGHLFAHVKRAPNALLREIGALAGVEAADGWVSGAALLDVPGLAEPANAKIVGLLPDKPSRVNRVTIEHGRAPAPWSRDEVAVSEGFAEANDLSPGDTLAAVLNGTWRRLRIVGVGLSPEFIYELRPGDLFPDNRRFGILWMDRRVVEEDFGLIGEWTDLAIRVNEGTPAPALIARLDRMLERHGSFGAFDRERHVSHRYVSEEINQNRTFAAVIPMIFLAVAAFLLNLVLSRIVASQREQVGMLKAYGCGTATLVRHYATIALIPVAVGSAAGCLVGLWAANAIAGMYQEFFRFPGARFSPSAGVFVTAVLASLAAALAGALSAVRRVAKLAPADAMRAEAPARYAHGVIERLRLDRLLGPVGRMTVRALVRRPLRNALAVLGLAFGASVIIVGSFGYDAIARIREVQFERADREDLAVAFTAPRGAAVIHELAGLPGVTRVEPSRGLAVRVRHAAAERQVALLGIEDGAQLRRVVDVRGRPVRIPSDGIALSVALATRLSVGVGDTVTVDLLEGRRTRHEMEVSAVVNDLLGMSAYVPAASVSALAGSADAISGAALAADPSRTMELYERLKRTPGVTSVAVRRALMENFDALVERAFEATLLTLVLFAAAIAVGVVYNTARITLAERGRELASLRVLGFTRGEVARMLFGEQAVLTLVSLPVGAALGASLAWATVRAMGSTELWRMPFTISGRTFAAAALMIGVASLASGLLVRRRLDRLDLVQVLKTRE